METLREKKKERNAMEERAISRQAEDLKVTLELHLKISGCMPEFQKHIFFLKKMNEI